MAFGLEGWFERLARHTLRRRRFYGAVVAVVLLIAGAGTLRLGFDFRVQDFFPAESPELNALERLRAHFGPDDQDVLVLVEAEDVFEAQALGYAQSVYEALADEPYVRLPHPWLSDLFNLGFPRFGKIDSIFSTAPFSGDEDTLRLEPLADPLPVDRAGREALRAAVQDNPLFRGSLVSEDDSLLALRITLGTAPATVNDLVPLLTYLDALVDQVPRPEGVKLHKVGVPVVRRHILEQIQMDLLKFLPLGGLVTLLVLWLLFGDRQGLFVPVAAVAGSVALSVGGMGWLGINMDMLSNVLPTIVIVYGVADAVHMLSRVREEGQNEGGIVRGMGHLGVACLLTSGTTAVGFLSLGVSDMTMIRRFGMLSAGGVAAAYLVSLLVVPMGTAWLKAANVSGPGRTQLAIAERLRGWGEQVFQRRRSVVYMSLLFSGGLLWFGAQVEADNQLLDAFKPGHPVEVATQRAEEKLQGVVAVDVLLEVQDGSLLRPARLVAADRFARWAATQPGVTEVLGYPELFAEANRGLRGERALPTEAAALAQYAALMSTAIDESGLLIGVEEEHDMGRLSLRLEDIGAVETRLLKEKLEASAKGLLGPVGVSATVIGSSLVVQDGIARLSETLLRSVVIALLVILLLIAWVFGSWKAALATLIPNVFPLLVALGVMYLFGIPIDPTTMIVFSVGLGIAVDDTIHFLARYREEMRSGKSVEAAIQATLETAGFAMLVTSTILVLGFGTVMVSSFPSTVTFGQLGVVIFASAIFCDLVVTPSWVAWLRLWETR